MRTFPTNSPHAAGRTMAMALLVDNHRCRAEPELIDRLDVARQRRLARSALHALAHGFGDDLLTSAGGGWADVCRIDCATRTGLLAETTDPAPRRQVRQLCTRVVDVDDHLADVESTLLLAAVAQRKPQRAGRQAPPTGVLQASHA